MCSRIERAIVPHLPRGSSSRWHPPDGGGPRTTLWVSASFRYVICQYIFLCCVQHPPSEQHDSEATPERRVHDVMQSPHHMAQRNLMHHAPATVSFSSLQTDVLLAWLACVSWVTCVFVCRMTCASSVTCFQSVVCLTVRKRA